MSFLDEEFEQRVPETADASANSRGLISTTPGNVPPVTQSLVSESVILGSRVSNTAEKVLSTVNVQTEQLLRIERDSIQTERNLLATAEMVKGLKSWWTTFTKAWAPVPEVQEVEEEVPQLNFGVAPTMSRGVTTERDSEYADLANIVSDIKSIASNTRAGIEQQLGIVDNVMSLTQTNRDIMDAQSRSLA